MSDMSDLELSKHGFNDMPDFTLGVLQSRFSAKSLESLYKKYEQRYQLSKTSNIQCRSSYTAIFRQFYNLSVGSISDSLRYDLPGSYPPQELLLQDSRQPGWQQLQVQSDIPHLTPVTLSLPGTRSTSTSWTWSSKSLSALCSPSSPFMSSSGRNF